MKLYNVDGWADIPAILDYCERQGCFTIFLIGGRGTGKTYGALSYVLDSETPFMYMRRTQAQADMVSRPEFSPFKSINDDRDIYIGSVAVSKYSAGFYHMEQDSDDKWKPVGAPLGYSCALSTISNMRGFDASNVRLLIYDEFIPERHERPIKNEAAALFNAYETINRNREIKGEKPLVMLCLSNANDLANPIFMELGLVDKVERVRQKGRSEYIDRKRGCAVILLTDSPISHAKRETALYRLTAGTQFADMALANDFTQDHPINIISKDLKQYRPLCSVGEITIYKHKSAQEYYVSIHRSGSPRTYDATPYGCAQFRKEQSWLSIAYLEGRLYFESYSCQKYLTNYLKTV